METILVILGLLVAALAVYYWGFYKKGKINDADGDFIPDEVEEAVEKTKKVVKEVKRRGKRVKEEIKDVIEDVKEIASEVDDVVQAAKGRKRRGRKPKK